MIYLVTGERLLLNIKAYDIYHILYDMLIPISVLYILSELSILIRKYGYMFAKLFQKAGMASMVLFYVHATLLDIVNRLISPYVKVGLMNFLYFLISILILFIGILLYEGLRKFSVTDKWMLGNS